MFFIQDLPLEPTRRITSQSNRRRDDIQLAEGPMWSAVVSTDRVMPEYSFVPLCIPVPTLTGSSRPDWFCRKHKKIEPQISVFIRYSDFSSTSSSCPIFSCLVRKMRNKRLYLSTVALQLPSPRFPAPG
jgi:hypothetical protein